jgi:hypothetical protein
MDDDHLPVDDRLTRDVEGAGNDRETIDQLWPLRVKGLPVVVVDVELDAVTVVFDFVNHCAPEGAFTFRVASWRLIKPRMEARSFLARTPVRFASNATHVMKNPPSVLGATAGQSTYLIHDSPTARPAPCSTEAIQALQFCRVVFPRTKPNTK